MPALAGFARDLHARQALQRFGQVQFREFRDVLGDDHILLDDSILLDVARVAQRLRVAGDDHRFDLGAGGRLTPGLPQRGQAEGLAPPATAATVASKKLLKLGRVARVRYCCLMSAPFPTDMNRDWA